MKINMLGVLTDQFAEMRDFYRDVLGFEVVHEQQGYVEFGGQPLRVAISTRAIMQQVTGSQVFAQPAAGSPFELAFQCESREQLDQQYQHLLDKGAIAVKAGSEMSWGQYTAFFADPDGHVHELFVDAPA